MKCKTNFITIPNVLFNAEIKKGLRVECESLTGITEDFKTHTLYATENNKFIAGIIAVIHGSILWIDSIYVIHERKRQGLGKSLINQIMAYAKDYNISECQLNTYFPESYLFFVAMGFETVSMIPNWKYGLTCYLMRKSV